MPYDLPESLEPLLLACDVQWFRAGGPGGQHQNKTSTAVRLVHLESGITVVQRASRSPRANLKLALERLQLRLDALNTPEKPRVPTRPTKASRVRRLDDKKRNASRKQDRKRPDF